MSNYHTLVEVFSTSLGIDASRVSKALKYNGIPEWDSVAHMALVGEIENAFDVMLDTNDIIDMSSVEVAIGILEKHGITFET